MMDAEKLIADAVSKLVKQQTGDSAGKLAAFESLMEEVKVALGDLVLAIEDDKDEDDPQALAKALVDALKTLKLPTVTVPAPAVSVNVEPAPVNNHMPQPLVQIVERQPARGWEVTFKFDGMNQNVPTGMTLMRIN